MTKVPDIWYPPIKEIAKYQEAWTKGLPIRITEKLHGVAVGFGVMQMNGEWDFVDGGCEPNESMMRLLNNICDGENQVFVYGEHIGVMGLDYGVKEPTVMVYDIMVNGEYLPWDLILGHCETFGVRTVPLLYEGPFTWEIVKAMTVGGSTVANPSTFKSDFKGREGIVVTPQMETDSDILGGRLIGKSTNPDFANRVNKTYTYWDK